MKPVDKLISYWSKLDISGSTFIHSDDRDWLLDQSRELEVIQAAPVSPEDWMIAARGNQTHVSLLPLPYVGDLRNAQIIICLLNPGISAGDFYAEQHVPAYREIITRTIQQNSIESDQYPFFALDPKWCWTGAYRWWSMKLHNVVAELENSFPKYDFVKAGRLLAKNIAAVELFPYHSRDFRMGKALQALPSCDVARTFIHSLSEDRDRTVIITRQIQSWGFGHDDNTPSNFVLYGNGEQRAAHLTRNSRGGKVILERLKGHFE